MSIEQTMQGKWCLLVEEEPYRDEGRTLIEFRDGAIVDNDGVKSAYRVDGNTLIAPLGDQVTLAVNPGDTEMRAPANGLPADADTVQANVTTSFDDGSDDLVEYALLIRETD